MIGSNNVGTTTFEWPTPNQTNPNLKPEWKFTSTKTYILNGKEMDDLKDQLEVYSLPEQTFHTNLKMEFLSKGFLIEFNAKDAIEYCKTNIVYNNLQNNLQKKNSQPILMPIKVSCHELWNNKTLEINNTINNSTTVNSTVNENNLLTSEQIEEREDNIDWCYTSLYKGTIITKNSNQQDNTENTENNKKLIIKESNTDLIDYNLLKRNDIPIVFYDELLLFEDELHDHGTSYLTIKFRVMNNQCFYLLMRNFIRVDHVCIRCVDTRYYFNLNQKDKLIREFHIKEEDWNVLEKKWGNEFLMKSSASAANEAMIVNGLKMKWKVNECIYLE
ncbi:hypothetical protein ABK040_007617 [Willaertia magna]